MLSLSVRFSCVSIPKISQIYILLITNTPFQVFSELQSKNYIQFVIIGSRGKDSTSIYAHSLSFLDLRLIGICIHHYFVSFLSLLPNKLTYLLTTGNKFLHYDSIYDSSRNKEKQNLTIQRIGGLDHSLRICLTILLLIRAGYFQSSRVFFTFLNELG